MNSKMSYPIAIVISLGIAGLVTYVAKGKIIESMGENYSGSSLVPVCIFPRCIPYSHNYQREGYKTITKALKNGASAAPFFYSPIS